MKEEDGMLKLILMAMNNEFELKRLKNIIIDFERSKGSCDPVEIEDDINKTKKKIYPLKSILNFIKRSW
jgi:hypothetical protein